MKRKIETPFEASSPIVNTSIVYMMVYHILDIICVVNLPK